MLVIDFFISQGEKDILCGKDYKVFSSELLPAESNFFIYTYLVIG